MYLWTSISAESDTKAKLLSGGLTPAAVYIDGRRQSDLGLNVALKRGANPLLVRYDGPGRGHFVVEKLDAPEPKTKTPLAMKWYDRPGVLPYDVRSEEDNPAGWYRFTSPPGLVAMTVICHGVPTGWADGRAMRVEEQGIAASGTKRYRLTVETPIVGQASVALRIEQERGFYAGSTMPEPIQLDCGPGRMNLGDWSKDSVLECYSGGAWYRKTVTLSSEQVNGRVLLNLGKVVATAEVHVNGRKMGVCVSPPWTVDISKAVKAGENRIEVLVYNTLANHYVTIPTRYRGPIESGLIGPVTIETRPIVSLKGGIAR